MFAISFITLSKGDLESKREVLAMEGRDLAHSYGGN